LRAPNTDAGFVTLEPTIVAAAQRMFSDRTVVVERVKNDPRERLAVDVVLRPLITL
jgi:hypothetical protein